MNRFVRLVRGWTLASALLFGVAPATAPAQDFEMAQPVGEPASEGNPLYGYLAAGVLIGMMIFVICMSARR